jgi:hypothetical protein
VHAQPPVTLAAVSLEDAKQAPEYLLRRQAVGEIVLHAP